MNCSQELASTQSSTDSNSQRIKKPRRSSDKLSFRKRLRLVKAELLGVLAGILLAVLIRTLRISFKFECPEGSSFGDQDTPVLVAFWHGRQLMMPALRSIQPKQGWRKSKVLSSRHADGRIAARAVSMFGISSIAGSSTRGGASAVLAAFKAFNSGSNIVITPDGPKGPRHKCKPGIVRLAQLTAAKVYPVSFAAKRSWCFKSWDRMVMPKPFSEVVFFVARPIDVHSLYSKSESKQAAEAIEKALMDLESRADSYDFN